MGKYFSKIKLPERMKNQIEKIIIYSGNGKKPVENLETELSSNNDNRWLKGSVSEKSLRRVVVRSEIRTERRGLEPLAQHHRKPRTVREPKRIEAKNSMSSIDRIADEENFNMVEALKRQVQGLKRKLKKNTQRSKPSHSLSTPSSNSSTSESEEDESSDGRKHLGRSSGKGFRGNWSETPVSIRQL